jgi:hypothetical protein
VVKQRVARDHGHWQSGFARDLHAWAAAIRPVGSDRFRLVAQYSCNGPGPIHHPNNFSKHSNDSNLHNMKLVLLKLQNFPNLAWW